MKRTLWLGFVITLATLLASPVVAQPFTYQGFLKQNGQPVNGTRSMTFKLFTALTGGSQVGDHHPECQCSERAVYGGAELRHCVGRLGSLSGD